MLHTKGRWVAGNDKQKQLMAGPFQMLISFCSNRQESAVQKFPTSASSGNKSKIQAINSINSYMNHKMLSDASITTY